MRELYCCCSITNHACNFYCFVSNIVSMDSRDLEYSETCSERTFEIDVNFSESY